MFFNHTIISRSDLRPIAHHPYDVLYRFTLDMMCEAEQRVCYDWLWLLYSHSIEYWPPWSLEYPAKLHEETPRWNCRQQWNCRQPDPEMYKWFFSSDWLAGLMHIEIIILIVLLVLVFLSCYGILLLWGLIDKTVHSRFGQYMQLHLEIVDPESFPPDYILWRQVGVFGHSVVFLLCLVPICLYGLSVFLLQVLWAEQWQALRCVVIDATMWPVPCWQPATKGSFTHFVLPVSNVWPAAEIWMYHKWDTFC